ncbi:MAG TPA: zinc-ribbon domain-containing protein [Polyangium sp.]|nr:zinc-ribbon domain-containing protein [Polyangium sp.]
MKITCQSCQAKYTIADEKVVGKTVKIKCKKCGAAIVVNANEAAAAGDAHAQGHEPEEEDGATRVFSGDPAQDPAAGYGTGAGPDWTVNVRDDDQRTMSAAQIAAAFAAGTITGDTYVWRDGMGDWLPLSQVPELQGTMSRGAAPAPVQAAPPPTDDDLNATVAMNPEAAAAHYAMPGAAAAAPAAAAAAPVAARKAARGGQDLFGAGGAAAASPFDAGAAPATNQLQKSLEQKAVGERNENSVLFSLASLTATEKAAAAPDLGPKKKPARSGLDDIMNMGGGGSMGAAMLAPPPIMAPVIEPPPQQFAPQAPAPMPMQQQMGGMPGSMPPPAMAASPGMGMISIPPPAQKKTPVGLIVGIVVGVLALAGVGVVLATSGGDKEATGENAANSAAVVATSAAPTNTAANTAAPTQTVAANTAPTNTAPAGDPGSTTKSTSGGPAPAGTGTGKPTGTAAPTASTAPTTAPTPTATAETPPPSGGGAEFNRAAASSALNAAAGAARGCKKPDGPTGTAKVKVTFAPSGNVTTSQVQGAPFAGTPVGGCIAAAFRSAKVPAFEGSPVSVSKSVTIN